MIAKFNLIGMVTEINEPKVISNGNTLALITVDVDGLEYPVLLQGKLLSFLAEGKIKVKDIVYVEGRLQKDRLPTLASAKLLCHCFASFINVIT